MASQDPHNWMDLALDQAKKAASTGEVPIGAIIVVENQLISSAHNLVETNSDPTAHAEILALRSAGKTINNWRLTNAELYVTLEPCSMCIGAMILARIKSLYFACYDPRQGAVGSLFDLSSHPSLPHQIQVHPELKAAESTQLLKNFFQQKRI